MSFNAELLPRQISDASIKRFWAKVQITESCWLWVGSVQPNGYGQLTIDGKHQYPHRVSWELLVGPIPEGLQIDHLCRVRNCVNPDHLEPVTAQENTRRKPVQTHCINGHLYDEKNTSVSPKGKKGCRRCNANRAAARRAKMKEAP